MAHYFERMKGIVESHGGSEEKFIGDAVMGVFGVPVAQKDDALRACRAAVRMREALLELGIAGRIGVNTGEVVTGTEERLATGDAVNVAARLEQAAQPGEVLVGAETLRLVHAAVAVGDEQQQELKARRSPCRRIRCWRSRASCSRRSVSNGASRNGDGDSRLLRLPNGVERRPLPVRKETHPEHSCGPLAA
jgi:class 3 adenylate cyclase